MGQNRMYFHQGVMSIETEGEIELIGPSLVPVLGGAAAFWVKTKASMKNGTGKIRVSAHRPGLEDQEIQLSLISEGKKEP